MASWPKNSKYGKTGTRTGGGKLDCPASKGNRGVAKVVSMPGKASVAAKPNKVDAPGRIGNRGVIAKGMKKVRAKAPID
jgi:hypothetical protein